MPDMAGRIVAGNRRRGEMPVARQILLLQVGVVVVLVVVGVALAAYDARRDARDAATERSISVARAVADSPTVREAVQGPDPTAVTAVLQPYAEQARLDTDTDFVVVMNLDRIRFTHPNPDNIGKEFVGDVGRAP